MKERYTQMRSVSFTETQANALERRAKIEDRKTGNLIRRAVVQYLEAVGELPERSDTALDDDEV